MTANQFDTEELLDRAGRGDGEARQDLLTRHRHRLRQMVAVRLDHRLAARLDPSDIVQEALADAAQGLDEYLRDRPVPFYPWLRRFAWERLVEVNRRHVLAKRRTVTREEKRGGHRADSSSRALAARLLARGTSPSRRLMDQELRDRVQGALDLLDAGYREVLMLRYLEQLSTAESAAALGISVGAVKMRHLRALERLRANLGTELGESR
jgi:RNA polymerase sigma-70 factor (ECF subfamily)